MVDLSVQKRLAAQLLGVGESRVWLDPENLDRISEAMTREEVRKLIHDGVIGVKPVHSNSRARWRRVHQQKKKGRRRGHGSRKGKATARTPKKEVWMTRIRKMRRYLRWLRDHGYIDARTYRRYYMLAKGGAFRSLSSIRMHLESEGVLRRR